MEKIKIILVDDHRIVRDGIRSILVPESDFEVVGQASTYEELKSILSGSVPDIVILDISLGEMSGIDIARVLNLNYPSVRILMLTMYTDEDFILNSIKAGAKGYLPKNTTKKELIQAIHTINNGGEFFSDEIKNVIMKSYIKKAHDNDKPRDYSKTLTRREEEILRLSAMGQSNREIADRLFISARTVESHKNHIMTKLDLKSNVDLIKFAIKNKIIDIE